MSATIIELFFKFLDLAPRYLIAIAVISAFLLVAPDGVLEHLGIHDFAQHNRSWFGLGLVVSVPLFLAYCGEKIIHRVRDAMARKEAVKESLQYLHTLTEGEKQILRFYIAQKTKTNCLRVNDGVVQGLVAAGIIYPASSMGCGGFCVNYNLCDSAWNYLNGHKSLLRGTTNTCRKDNPDDFG